MSDDLQIENKEQRVQAAKTKEVLGRLVASEGWHMLLGIVQKRAGALQQSILMQPLSEDFSAYKQEFRKGHAVGLLEVFALAQQELMQANELLAALPGEEDLDNA